jgi:hypothetical protein
MSIDFQKRGVGIGVAVPGSQYTATPPAKAEAESDALSAIIGRNTSEDFGQIEKRSMPGL